MGFAKDQCPALFIGSIQAWGIGESCNLPAMSIMSIMGGLCQVPKRCVVTGGLGFVGQRLVETLVERGAEQVWGPGSWSWAWEPVEKDAKIREKRELQARTKMNQDKQLVSLGGYKMFQPVF